MFRSQLKRQAMLSLAMTGFMTAAALSFADDRPTASTPTIPGYGNIENSVSGTDPSGETEYQKADAVTQSLQDVPAMEDPSLDLPKAVPLPPFPDAGTPAMIDKIKADFLTAMDLDGDIMEGSVRPSSLGQLVSAVYSEMTAPEQLQLANEAWDAQLADAAYTPFTDDRFEVREWQGIRVSDVEGHIQVLASRSYFAGSWTAQEPEQYQTDLTLESGVFKIARMFRVEPYCAGTNCNGSVSP